MSQFCSFIGPNNVGGKACRSRFCSLGLEESFFHPSTKHLHLDRSSHPLSHHHYSIIVHTFMTEKVNPQEFWELVQDLEYLLG